MAEPRPIFDPDRMAADRVKPAVPRQLTVSQLNAIIKRVLGDQLPGTLHLLGEISNFTRATSGHLYMTLKDDHSEIRGVMWRSAAERLKFEPEDGLEVIATGHVDVYEPRGQVQFYIRKLEPKGVGSLELAFRQLHDRLASEGLFDAKHKRPIPRYPRQIAIVTSPTGAAVSDILDTLRRRFPCVRALLVPVRVQGEGSAGEIAGAIGQLNAQADRLGGIDVMIVGRGGGSLEDLWAFNEEIVARAVFASEIPVISAVGHEVDITIADLVADLRAPTPTAAAELAVPVLDEIRQSLDRQRDRLGRAVRHRLDRVASRLDTLTRNEWFRDPLAVLMAREQQIDESAARLRLAGSRQVAQLRSRLHEIEVVLRTIQPQAILQKKMGRLNDVRHRLRWALRQHLHQFERQIARFAVAIETASPRQQLRAGRHRLDQCVRSLDRSVTHRLALTRQGLDGLEAQLESTSYRRTLARGFTLTRTGKDRQIVTRPDQVALDDEITTETAEGVITSRVIPSSED